MAANGISTLPTKQIRQLAKLDIAQARRQGYSTFVPAGSQQVSSDYGGVYPNIQYPFGSLKVISNGAGSTYLVFESRQLVVTAITSYLYNGAPIHNIRYAGNDHFDAVSIVGGLVDCSTLAGLPQAGAVGYLLSASLGVTTNHNVGFVEIPNGRFVGSGSANTGAPFYRARHLYDITQLPDTYNDNGSGPDDNPNVGGLIEGRPWVSTPPLATPGSDPTGLDGYLTFNGTSTYLATPGSADYNVAAGDFTVEWVQKQTGGGSHPRVFSIGTDTSASLGVSIESGTLYVWFAGTVGTSVAMPAWYLDGRWLHVAISRQGNQLKVLFNGQVAKTATNSTSVNNSTDQLTIGADINPSGGYWSYFPGKLSNFRWTKSAVYTGDAFSLTSPLSELAETKLLLLMTTDSTKYVDSATEAHVMTPAGSPTWSAFP
jgi:hypothetical protein